MNDEQIEEFGPEGSCHCLDGEVCRRHNAMQQVRKLQSHRFADLLAIAALQNEIKRRNAKLREAVRLLTACWNIGVGLCEEIDRLTDPVSAREITREHKTVLRDILLAHADLLTEEPK